MLRKILLFVITAFILFWLAGAYYLKSKIISFAEKLNTPNSTFSYKTANIGGFPFRWTVKLVEPKFTTTAQSNLFEIDCKAIWLNFNYSLNKISLTLPKQAEYRANQNNKIENYQLKAKQYHNFEVKLSRSLYRKGFGLDIDNVKNINLNIPKLVSTYSENGSFFDGEMNLFLLVNLEQIEAALKYKLVTIEGQEANRTNEKPMTRALDLNFAKVKNITDSESNQVRLNINECLIRGYGKAGQEIGLQAKGEITLLSNRPVGKLQVQILAYREIVNEITPYIPNISQAHLEKIIVKAVMNDLGRLPTDEDKIDFEVVFSEKGIMIGNVYLINF